jgi:EmrB/QacA subfamily drug resistance transporter
LVSRPSKRLTLIATILGSMVAFVDGTVVNVALPALRDDLGAGLTTQQWVVEAYLLTLGSLVLVGGSLGDLFGRRRVFMFGVAAFGAASLLCAVAPSGGFLIAARALQGVAGALLVPSSLAILTATFDEGERGAAIGSWTAWTGIAIVIGPLIGGALVDLGSWRTVFAINVPLVVMTLWMAARGVPESRTAGARPALDWPGALLCALGLAGVVFGLTELHTLGLGTVAPALAGGTALLAAFVLREARAPEPMLPLGLFRSRRFTAANLTTVGVYGGLGAAILFLTLFLQQVAGYSAFESGLVVAPVTLLLFLLSRRFGALSERSGPRLPMTAGPLLAGAGLLSLVRVDESGPYLGVVMPGLLAFGVGLALTVAPLTTTALGAVEQRHAGIASGVNNAVARVAGLVAIAIVGAAVSAQFASSLDERLAAGPRLTTQERAGVERAKERALAEAGTDAEQAGLSAAIREASVEAFRLGIAVAGGLVILGGVIAWFGLRTPRREGELGVLSTAPRGG